MGEYKLRLKKESDPPVVVPWYSVETYFAIGEEQADRMGLKRCIEPELPDNHFVYSAMHDLPETMYESMERYDGSNEWKIRKDRLEEIAHYLRLDKAGFPYHEAMDMIEGDFFWIITWDD